MMKYLAALLMIFILSPICLAQIEITQTESQEAYLSESKPKLVVGIVVDQMRYDYLTRFYSKYGKGGFKRMINEGFDCKNNRFNYVPTYTGPGHASIFTGTTPKYHGIISNNWYDKEIKSIVYCVQNDTIQSVGTDDISGQMSPHRMKTTTFADENRLFTQMEGKTVGISMKDRGSILPAGHTANAAYWYQGKGEGLWISSTYYMKRLPQWVKDFNDSGIVKSYLKDWNTLYKIKTYTESGEDSNLFEGGFIGKETATFPYDLDRLKDKNGIFDILRHSPYGNSLTADFAIAAIDGEQLGQDNITDVLTVSFSCTDYIGHKFGVNSKEVEDTYLRLDLDLERLFNALDEKVGKGEYTVFLTSDHGAVDVPSYLKSVGIPAGYVNDNEIRRKISGFMYSKFKETGLVENLSNDQVFLNREKIKGLGLELEDVQQALVDEIITYDHVDKVYSAQAMSTNFFSTGIEELLQNGFNQKRSGDIIIVTDPGYSSYGRTGSTHGTGFDYDTHVPLLFFGKGIKHGETWEETDIIDIAPTMSALLGISFPNACTGRPLTFVLD